MLKNVSPGLIENVKDLKIALNELTVHDLSVYSMVELYYKVAHKLNEVINELSRFEGVLSDEVIKQNEKLIYLLGEGLEIEVVKEIDNLIKKGFFEELINEKIFSDLNNKIDTFKSEIDSQLAHKTNKSETQNIQQQINNLVLESGGDSNLEVVQARGEFNTLNDRLNDINETTIKNISTNLINTSKFMYVGTNGSTHEKINDITYKVSCVADWGGTFNHAIKASYGRTYMVICKVKASDSSSVGKNCWLTFYQYNNGGINLGGVSAPSHEYYRNTVSLNSDYMPLYYAVTTNNENITRLDIGISSASGVSFTMTEPIILDITGLSDDEIKNIDFPQYGYWANYIDNFVSAKYSLKSKVALGLSEEYKNSIIQMSVEKATMETMPFLNETYKLNWTTKGFKAEETLSWWIENKSKNLFPNSTYLYIVKWHGKNQDTFFRCNELRDGKWHDTLTVTNQYASNNDVKVMAWIFNTDDVITSPNLCCMINNPTLIEDLNLNVELYKISNVDYINTKFAVDVANTYLKGNVINDYDFSNKIKWNEEEEEVIVPSNKWYGKNALVIGDSITASGQWQKKLNEDLGMNVTTHAKGGIGIIAMVDGDKGLGGDYDNETNASGTIYPLNADKVKDKDLIVVLPAYNERAREYGQIGDLYPSQTTIIGMIQYQINRIYEELTKANNLNCKVLIATPHCAGKYNYVDADGYDEYPSNSGRTMQTLSNKIKEIANYNNIPVCDLWNNSGINKFTWSIYGAQANAVNENYTKYELNAQGEVIGEAPLRYVKGKSYYQLRNGQVVLEEYTGVSPYPFNGDQLHCSTKGYARIGECIVGSIIKSYGY